MLLPIALDVAEKPCLVVGGGIVAARKVRSLLECGAQVRVVAPRLSDDFLALLDEVECFDRCFEPGDCNEMRLVFACTNSILVNGEVCKEAQRLGIWCNVADRADNPQRTDFNAMAKSLGSDFHSLATIRQGDIVVTVSTNGGSPALSKHLKAKIESVIGDEYAQLLCLMSERRATIEYSNAQTERANKWRAILESDVLELLRRGEPGKAAQRVNEILNDSNEPGA